MKSSDLEMIEFVWRKVIQEQSDDWRKVFSYLNENFIRLYGEIPQFMSSNVIRKELN